MIIPIHKAYILFMRSLSVAAPGLKVTCIGGDAAVEMEEIVRDTSRRQWFIFGHLINPYADDDVRWMWWESECEIMRGERLAPKNETAINGEKDMGTEIKSPDEFMAGQIACQNGEKCCQGASKDFERGYMAQYELEQAMTARSERGGHK